jgi:mannose-6-phosphate isomerase-like protein (cupin superfamily)
MNKDKIVKQLKDLYPDAFIFLNDQENPTEIIAEVDPKNGFAVAVIDSSYPHHHNFTYEKYVVKRGSLKVIIDGKSHVLNAGDEIEIKPGQVHSATGNETWIEVTTTPPWTAEDQILEGVK